MHNSKSRMKLIYLWQIANHFTNSQLKKIRVWFWYRMRGSSELLRLPRTPSPLYLLRQSPARPCTPPPRFVQWRRRIGEVRCASYSSDRANSSCFDFSLHWGWCDCSLSRIWEFELGFINSPFLTSISFFYWARDGWEKVNYFSVRLLWIG